MSIRGPGIPLNDTQIGSFTNINVFTDTWGAICNACTNGVVVRDYGRRVAVEFSGKVLNDEVLEP